MAVYKRGYQRYTGPLTGRWTRLLVFPRFAWRRLFGQSLVLLLIILTFWPLLCAGFIYLANHPELLQGLDAEFRSSSRSTAISSLSSCTSRRPSRLSSPRSPAPGLIAPDLANNALPLYFSRPLTRGDYVLARLIVLMGMLSMVTWVPGMLLFGLQVGMAGCAWFRMNWYIGAGIVAGFLMWLVVVSLVALASSAYVKWRVVAGAVILAFFFVLTGAAEMINEVFRVTWGHILIRRERSTGVVRAAGRGTARTGLAPEHRRRRWR